MEHLLHTKDFKIGFIMGVSLHLLMLFKRVKIFRMECVSGDCSDIVTFDIPVSLVYYAFPDTLLILFSAVLGSLLWGVWFWGLLKLVRHYVGD